MWLDIEIIFKFIINRGGNLSSDHPSTKEGLFKSLPPPLI